MKAIEVSTSTTINHWELGRLFAEWDNVEQAHFLHGATVGFADLGGWGSMQAGFIRDAAQADNIHLEVGSFIEKLHDYFKGES